MNEGPKIQRTPATLGAVVTGVSLAALDDAAWRAIDAAFLEHAVLIFPGQHLSAQQQIAFGERFGGIEELVKGHKIVPVSNKKADGTSFDAFENALFIFATVISRPNDERAVIDAGHKSLPVDSGMPEPFRRAGVVYRRPNDEHGVLMSEGGPLPHRGEKILIVPSHCDPTVNLHDWYICVRDLQGSVPRVESVWPVSARGAVF